MDEMNIATTQRLAQARSEREIVRIVRDYVSEWTPEDLSKLPSPCRPPKINDGIDICGFAYLLAKARFAAEGDDVEARLVPLEAFFAQAGARGAQVRALDEATRSAEEAPTE